AQAVFVPSTTLKRLTLPSSCFAVKTVAVAFGQGTCPVGSGPSALWSGGDSGTGPAYQRGAFSDGLFLRPPGGRVLMLRIPGRGLGQGRGWATRFPAPSFQPPSRLSGTSGAPSVAGPRYSTVGIPQPDPEKADAAPADSLQRLQKAVNTPGVR